MRTLLRAAAVAALATLAGTTGALADGWGDNTAYRNSGWAAATPDVRQGGEGRQVASRQRRAAVELEVTDEDRPQRRSRAVRPDTSRVAQGSVATGGGQVGVASFYWQGQRVASGGWFNPEGMTAAHRSLPFGTRVRVTHLGNGRSVDVTINDRGPFIAGRIIDLSRGAARVINMTGQGLARVQVTVLGR